MLEQAEKYLFRAAAFGNAEAYYNLASLNSLCERYEIAIYFLDKAHKCHTLPEIEDMMHDEWLENLKSTELFKHFLLRLKQNL